MKITILGASGFIGSRLAAYLKEKKNNYWAPPRDDLHVFKRNLGHVIYCIGVTADFRSRPFDTVYAHVCFLLKVLQRCKFDSFLYLSSTRVYGEKKGMAREEDNIKVQPLNFSDLYNISKIMGESICFAAANSNMRVVRLSNVYGDDFECGNFIPSLIRDALKDKKIILQTSLDSEKDYINIKDVVRILPQIAISGKHKIYNLASGKNISNGQIVNKLKKTTGCMVKVNENAQRIFYPDISVGRIRREFAFTPAEIIKDLGGLIGKYDEFMRRKNDKD